MEKSLRSTNEERQNCYCKDFYAYLNDFLFKRPLNFVLTVIVGFLSYGSFLFTKTINNDANAFIYSDPLSVIEQGRWGQTILALFGIADRDIFLWSDCLGLLLLILSCLLFAFLWNCLSNGDISYGSQLVFIALFISYPLNFEEFVYPTFLLKCGLAYCLIALSTTIIWFYHTQLSVKNFIFWSFLLSMSFSIYEAFVFAFVALNLIILWYYCMVQRDFYFKSFKKNILLITMILAVSLLIRFVINFSWEMLELGQVSYQPGSGPAKAISWLNENPVKVFARLGYGLFLRYIYPFFGYFAIMIFWGSAIIFLLYSFKCQKRNKALLLCFCVACTLFGLSILQGAAQPYRVCQAFPIFIAFTGMFIFSSLKRISYVAVSVLTFIVLLQTKELCILQNYDVEVSERGIHDMLVLERDLRQVENIEEKEIIFYGTPKSGFDVKKSMVHPLFYTWYPKKLSQHAGMSRFDSSWQFSEVFKHYSRLNPRCASKEEEKKFETLNLQQYPQTGYIFVSGNVVYVKLGEKEYPEDLSLLENKLRQLKRKYFGNKEQE